MERNIFVNRVIPLGTARRLEQAEMDRYRRVQPSAGARAGVAELPPREKSGTVPLCARWHDVSGE